MTGSEKQVAWAKDIINSGLDTIKANIKLNEKHLEETGCTMYETSARVWKAILIAAEIKASKFESASEVIDNKHKLDGRFYCKQADQIEGMIRSGKLTIEAFEEQAKAYKANKTN